MHHKKDSVCGNLSNRPLPFVVKLSQSQAAVGMIVVKNEKDRTNALRQVSEHLDYFVRKINIQHCHLYPSTIVVQELLSGQAMGLSLFVKTNGDYVWLGATPQLVEDGHFVGESIPYRQQAHFKQIYADLSGQVSKHLNGIGYSGPVGVDVMHDGQGKPLVIDINPRIPTSFLLCLLKGHLNKRGLHEAVSMGSSILECNRDRFETLSREELTNAEMIIVSACSVSDTDVRWMFSLIAGAETEAGVKSLVRRVKALAWHQ